MKKKILTVCLIFLSALILSARPEITLSPELEPSVKAHLNKVLEEMYRTPTGKFVLDHVSPDVKIQGGKLTAQWGVANQYNTVTLESLRLENKTMAAETERQQKAKICFTAEILAHELMHNGQLKAGLFQYPVNISGCDAVICEMLLELQAKLTGEKVFQEMRKLDEYRPFVQEKPGLLLTMQFASKNPEKDYLETIWRNRKTARLFTELLTEIRQWNRSYAEQGFRNNVQRFTVKGPAASMEQIKAHLGKIILFSNMPVTADFLLENVSVRPVPNGMDYYEDDVKVLNFEACPDGYRKHAFSGGVK